MKTYNFKSLIRSAARRIWMWNPARKEAIRNARVPNLRPFHVQCAYCSKRMRESAKPKEYSVDHIIPASEPAALIHSWDDFFDRLNVPANKLQILCDSCHDEKTAKENQQRRVRKTKAKRVRKHSLPRGKK